MFAPAFCQNRWPMMCCCVCSAPRTMRRRSASCSPGDSLSFAACAYVAQCATFFPRRRSWLPIPMKANEGNSIAGLSSRAFLRRRRIYALPATLSASEVIAWAASRCLKPQFTLPFARCKISGWPRGQKGIGVGWVSILDPEALKSVARHPRPHGTGRVSMPRLCRWLRSPTATGTAGMGTACSSR